MLALRRIPMIAVTAIGVNYMSSHAEYSLHYQTTPTQISTQRKPYYSFVALSVLLDYIVRRYIESLRMSAASPCRTRWTTSSTAGAKSTPDKALLCPPAPSLTPPESDRIHLRSPERDTQ